MRPRFPASIPVILVALAGCGDSPVEAPTAAQDLAESEARGSAVGEPARSPADGPVGGVGGAYTMTAGGERITALDLSPTGIVIPPGLPVRIRISGAITRTATSGLKQFCSLERWADRCASVWAEIVAETPIPPSGASFVGGAGRALVSWGGSDPASPSEGSSLVLEGPAGGELWAGRSDWGCYYVDGPDLQGPCFTFGGSYTVTVEVDDGGSPADSAISEGGNGGGGTEDAVLRATATLSGGSVRLVATAGEGAVLEGPTWTFIPDVFTTVEGDTTAAEGAAMTAAAASEAGPTTGFDLVTPESDSPGLHWGRPVQRVDPPSAPLGGSATHGARALAPPSSLSACDLLADCTVPVPATSGTFVVVATVDGRPLSASARASTTPEASVNLICPSSAVPRGELARCVASATPVGAVLAVTDWNFSPDDPELPPHERVTNRSDTDWPGRLVTSGTVTVAGTVDGRPASASARLTVAPRGWSGDMIPIEPPIPSDSDDMSEQPTRSAEEDGVFHLGHIHQRVSDIDLAGTLVPIGNGPNGGYGYFSGMPVSAAMTVHVNYSQLEANSALAQRHPVRAPTFDSNRTCVRSQLPALVAPIELHEGTTLDEKSHAGRFARTFNDLAAPAVEMVVLGPQDRAGEVLDALLSPIVEKAFEASSKADDDFKVRFPCNVNFFPN